MLSPSLSGCSHGKAGACGLCLTLLLEVKHPGNEAGHGEEGESNSDISRKVDLGYVAFPEEDKYFECKFQG